MSDRICLIIVDKLGNRSPVLYSYRSGYRLISAITKFYYTNKENIGGCPGVAMVNFISWLLDGESDNENLSLHNWGEEPEPESCDFFEFNLDIGDINEI